MGKDTVHLTGPDFSLSLCPFDHISPPVYSQRTLIFKLPDDRPYSDALSVLKDALQVTINEIPFLAGTVVAEPPSPEHNEQQSRRAIEKGTALFITQDLAQYMKFSDLQEANFAQCLLDGDLLSAHPITVGSFPTPVTKIQANFIDGGLLLVINLHHVAADGTAITTCINTLARNCRKLQKINSDVVLKTVGSNELSAGTLDRVPLTSGREGGGNIEKHTAFALMDEVPAAYTHMHGIRRPPLSEVFRIKPAAQKHLKASVSKFDESVTEGIKQQPYITTHDAVSALIWRCIMTARRKVGIISDSDLVSYYNPINIRAYMDPVLPPDFIGNGWYPVNPDIELPLLMGEHGLAAAAHHLRGSIKATNDNSLRDMISVINAIPNIHNIQFRCLTTITTTNLLTTSYRGFTHEPNWGPALGTYECFRLPNNSFPNGSAVILPVLKDGSWEIAITLDDDVMQVMKEDPLWQKYTIGPLGEDQGV